MPDTPSLDLDFARRCFPPVVWDWAFFENAGGTFVPQSVVDRLAAFMVETHVQPGASYATSAEAARRMAAGQRLMAEMINADADEVIIGPNTTANVYVLARALRPWFGRGDEIIVTNLDHEANSGAWRRLGDHGVSVREWRINPDTAELEIADLERLLGERTRLVCFPHCSNVTGGITDAAAITRKVHDAGALVCIDGVAYAPHRAIDVKALDADFYLFSPYKVYGPHLGLLYGKREHLLAAHSQMHFFVGEDAIPLKLNVGGANHELTAALTGIADYFETLHHHHFAAPGNDFRQRVAEVYGLFAAHEEALAGRFMDFLSSHSRIRLFGPATADSARRAPTFSFIVEGSPSAAIPPRLEGHMVALRNGNFYARRLVQELGLDPDDGVVRASMVHYNTLDEVDRLIDALDRALGSAS